MKKLLTIFFVKTTYFFLPRDGSVNSMYYIFVCDLQALFCSTLLTFFFRSYLFNSHSFTLPHIRSRKKNTESNVKKKFLHPLPSFFEIRILHTTYNNNIMRAYLTIILVFFFICTVSSRYISSSSEDETSSEVNQDSIRRDFREAILLARLRGLLNSGNGNMRSQLVPEERNFNEDGSDDSVEDVRKKRQLDDNNTENEYSSSEEDAAVEENNNGVEQDDESSVDDDEKNNGINIKNDEAREVEQNESKPDFQFEQTNDGETLGESNNSESVEESNDSGTAEESNDDETDSESYDEEEK